MGSYLNPGSKGFQESLNSEIYMDKTSWRNPLPGHNTQPAYLLPLTFQNALAD